MTKLEPAERSRTYVYLNGERLTYTNVQAIDVRRPSGNHRLELGDGRKVIVMAGWIAIELDVDGWTL